MRPVFSSKSPNARRLSNAATSTLSCLQTGVAMIPHPEKAHKGGEDAAFVTPSVIGVADGVGGVLLIATCLRTVPLQAGLK